MDQFSISEVLSSSQVCVCVCVSPCVFVCMCEISFLYRFGGLMRAWDSSPQRRVNLRHLLCTSSIFLDSWHFTSWTNCQLSKLNFRNDMSKFSPTPPPHPQHLPPSCSPFLSPPSPLKHIYLFAFTYMSSQRIIPNSCTHTHPNGDNHADVYTHTLERTNEVQLSPTPHPPPPPFSIPPLPIA